MESSVECYGGGRSSTARQKGRAAVPSWEAAEAGSLAIHCVWCRWIQGLADVANMMGGLDRSIQGPAVVVVEADDLGKNQRSDGAVKENDQGRCCCDRRMDQGHWIGP
ncbi:hypothetical protein ACLOJK_034503 [Asimina triloba]